MQEQPLSKVSGLAWERLTAIVGTTRLCMQGSGVRFPSVLNNCKLEPNG